MVDRSPAIQRAVIDGLCRAGISRETITLFERGDEMIHRFSELEPDVVLVEAEPLGIDMTDAVQAILLEDPGTRVIILVTDKYKQSSPVQDALAFGAFGLLEKPVRMDDVSRMLDTTRHERVGTGRIR